MMKRLSAIVILVFSAAAFCFSQSQEGNATYNPSKPGLSIDHSSLSFNTRVKVTNLENNRSVEAVVNGRIPISSGRIADIHQAAGDALGMNKTGATRVRIEELPFRGTAQTPPSPPPETVPVPPPPAPPQTVPVPVQQVLEQTAPPPQILPVETITNVEYIQVPTPVPSCAPSLLILILALLILSILLLAAILFLLARRLPLWPWYYPLWLRRYFRFAKKMRKTKPMPRRPRHF
jgi:hypothetical protein